MTTFRDDSNRSEGLKSTIIGQGEEKEKKTINAIREFGFLIFIVFFFFSLSFLSENINK